MEAAISRLVRSNLELAPSQPLNRKNPFFPEGGEPADCPTGQYDIKTGGTGPGQVIFISSPGKIPGYIFCIDGVLRHNAPARGYTCLLISRIKVMASMDIANGGCPRMDV